MKTGSVLPDGAGFYLHQEKHFLYSIQGEKNMRNCLLRKAAAAAALAVTAGTFAALPVSAADDFIFSDGFESGEGSWKGQLAYGKWLLFGHSGPAWQADFNPASILGEDGRPGEVAFKTGGWFEFDYLKSRLARYYEPPGLMFIVR